MNTTKTASQIDADTAVVTAVVSDLLEALVARFGSVDAGAAAFIAYMNTEG